MSSGSVLLRNVTEAEWGGEWRCRVENQLGSKEVTLNLVVYGKFTMKFSFQVLSKFPDSSTGDRVDQPELPPRRRRLSGQVHLPRLRLPGARRDVAPRRPPDQPGQVRRRRPEPGRLLQGQNGKCSYQPQWILEIGFVIPSFECPSERVTSLRRAGSTFRHQVISPGGGISNVSTAREGQLERMRGGEAALRTAESGHARVF